MNCRKMLLYTEEQHKDFFSDYSFPFEAIPNWEHACCLPPNMPLLGLWLNSRVPLGLYVAGGSSKQQALLQPAAFPQFLRILFHLTWEMFGCRFPKLLLKLISESKGICSPTMPSLLERSSPLRLLGDPVSTAFFQILRNEVSRHGGQEKGWLSHGSPRRRISSHC